MRSWKSCWVSRSRPLGSGRVLVWWTVGFRLGFEASYFWRCPGSISKRPAKGHRIGNSRNKPMLQAPDKLDNRVRLQAGRDHSVRSFAAKCF